MTQEISIFKKVETLSPSTIFSQGGIQPILDAIEKEISAEVPDTSTDKGRKAIASNAAKVSKSKTLLDKMGKELTDKLNLAIKPINAERRLARETLDLLRDRTREPLTQYEADEQAKAVKKFQEAEAEKLAIQVENDHEFALMLDDKFNRDLADLKAKAEDERIELEAKQLKEQGEREAQIAAEAAQAEILKAEQAIKDAEYEKQRAERQVLQQREEAEALAAKVAQQAIYAAEQVEADKLAAIKQAEINTQNALDEKRRVDEENQRQNAAELKAREADEDNRKLKNNEALKCLMKAGLSEKDSKLVVKSIAAKRITNIVINY
jgi:hypothetical protein